MGELATSAKELHHEVSTAGPLLGCRYRPNPEHLSFPGILAAEPAGTETDGIGVVETERGRAPRRELSLLVYDTSKRGMQALILICSHEPGARPELLRSHCRFDEEANALACLQPFQRPHRAQASNVGFLGQQRQGSVERRGRKGQERAGRARGGTFHQVPRTAFTASRSSEYARGSSALNFMFRYFTRPSGPMTYTVRRLYPAASLLAYCFDTR